MTTDFTTNTQANAAGVVNHATGVAVTGAGAATDTTFTCGFIPRMIRWQNVTDRIMTEWYNGLTSAQAIKTAAAGTRTLETSDVIVNNLDGTFTVKAAVIVASKTHVWEALG